MKLVHCHSPNPSQRNCQFGPWGHVTHALRRSLGLNLESLIIEQVCQSHLPPSSHCCVPVRSHLLLASLQWMLWGFVLGSFKVSCTYSFMFLGSSSGPGSLGALDRFWPEAITVTCSIAILTIAIWKRFAEHTKCSYEHYVFLIYGKEQLLFCSMRRKSWLLSD